jgi:hypothetical protein
MIRHAEEIGGEGFVGRYPSMIPGGQSDSKMFGASDISVAASRISPISRQRDLPPCGGSLGYPPLAAATGFSVDARLNKA